MNSSYQHPKLVGYQTTPRSHYENGRISSIRSMWDNIIRLQQYLWIPRLSISLEISSGVGSLPVLRISAIFSSNFTLLEEMTFPQLKHLTGIIMESPVGFLPLSPCTTSHWFLGHLSSYVIYEKCSVILPEKLIQLVVLKEFDKPLGNCCS